jgi:hypothetical protein
MRERRNLYGHCRERLIDVGSPMTPTALHVDVGRVHRGDAALAQVIHAFGQPPRWSVPAFPMIFATTLQPRRT